MESRTIPASCIKAWILRHRASHGSGVDAAFFDRSADLLKSILVLSCVGWFCDRRSTPRANDI